MEENHIKFKILNSTRTPKMFRRISYLYLKLFLATLLIVTVWFLAKKDWKGIDDTYPQRKCYEYDAKRALNITEPHWFLEDILKSTRQPRPGRTIFFHVTNCLNLYVEISNRQACTIESAARLNPDWDIFVLFASPVAFTLNMSNALRTLIIHPNIYWRNVDFWAYAKDTPAQEWILDRNQLLKSKFLAVHLSDYIRLVSLYRYGGTHMDLDFVMTKTISHLEPNYACAASTISVNNAILNFDHTGFGHEFVKKYLGEFGRNFRGNEFAFNGPMLLTSLLQGECKTMDLSKIKRDHCKFEVIPREAFFLIDCGEYKLLIDGNHTAEVALKTKDSMGVHFWNTLSKAHPLRIGSDKPSLYEKLAKEFCPRLYESLDEYF